MPPGSEDTICAIATAPGRSGIGVIRVSGDLVPQIASAVLGFSPEPRHAHFCSFLDEEKLAIDTGIAIYFQEPDSFTGEHVLELQGHGGVQVLSSVLERVVALNARIARPGEFSERSFLNNKMDLVQAEAVADLINAGSKQAARSAMRTLQGEFSREIRSLLDQLVQTRVHVEAAIDFSDEDIDVMSDTGVRESVSELQEKLEQVFQKARQGAILREGINVVIAGRPNAGKSSLLNALSGMESAIVTSIPGTTRDLLREEIVIDGMPVHVIDTAGLRDTDDMVEQEGLRRAHDAISAADRILLVIDSSAPSQQDLDRLLRDLGQVLGNTAGLDAGDSQLARTSLVFNKTDLVPDQEAGSASVATSAGLLPAIYLSARTGQGMQQLRQHLKDCIGFQDSGEASFVARKRHLDALRNTSEYLNSASHNVSKQSPLELLAEDLRLAQQELGKITGQFTSDDLLGEIFASFCIGK